MPKMTFDTTEVDLNNVQTFAPYEGDVPRPGTYNAEVRSVRLVESKAGNTYFKVLYVLGHDENPKKDVYFSCPIFDNVVPGQHQVQQERLAAFLKAICGKQKAVVDADDLEDGGKVNKIGGKEPVGVKVRVVVQRETYNNEPQARVAGVLPLPKGHKWLTEGPATDISTIDTEEEDEVEVEEDIEVEEEETEEVLEDEDEDEDESDDEDEEEEDEEDDEDDEDAEAELRAELADLDRAALKARLKASGSELTVKKSTTDDEIREAIVEAELGEEEEPF